MLKKTIIADFFTTINIQQFVRSLFLLCLGVRVFKNGKSIQIIETQLLQYLNIPKSKIISLYNGRTALYQTLKMIEVKPGDEVIISAYNCISVINAVIQSGAKPIYSDIQRTNLGLDPKKLTKNISKNTKVIVIQHTFGKPSDLRRISKIAKEKGILLIEDCAHSLGSELNEKKLGTWGDFGIFSTGRDKVISSVTGGFVVINNKKYFDASKKIMQELKMPPTITLIRDLMYNIVAYPAYKLYDFFCVGKCIIHGANKIKCINKIITKEEKNCQYSILNLQLPNILAFLASKELQKINLYTNKRLYISEYYNQNLKNPLLQKVFTPGKNEKNNSFRYPILLKNESLKQKLYNYMKKNKILLGKNWSGDNIVPIGSNITNTLYIKGSNPVAEDISKRILTLPNHFGVDIKDAVKIVNLINKFQ